VAVTGTARSGLPGHPDREHDRAGFRGQPMDWHWRASRIRAPLGGRV